MMLLVGTTFAGHDWNTGSMSNQLLFEPRRDTRVDRQGPGGRAARPASCRRWSWLAYWIGDVGDRLAARTCRSPTTRWRRRYKQAVLGIAFAMGAASSATS